jgi:hypothetical protein
MGGDSWHKSHCRHAMRQVRAVNQALTACKPDCGKSQPPAAVWDNRTVYPPRRSGRVEQSVALQRDRSIAALVLGPPAIAALRRRFKSFCSAPAGRNATTHANCSQKRLHAPVYSHREAEAACSD